MKILLTLIACCVSHVGIFDQVNRDIVLINVGYSDRTAIAKLINELNTMQPKVVAVDLAFGDSSEESQEILINALTKTPVLIMPGIFQNLGLDYHGKEMLSILPACSTQFNPLHAKIGFVKCARAIG